MKDMNKRSKVLFRISLALNMGFVALLIIGLYQPTADAIAEVHAGNAASQNYGKFVEATKVIQNEYVNELADGQLTEQALKGMVSALDPHSAYWTKEELAAELMDKKGEMVGIGVEVDLEDGVLKVMAPPMEGSPALRAGIRKGDRVIVIDSTPVLGLTLMEAVARVRGKAGTVVRLSILRDGVKKTIDMHITRAIVRTKSLRVERFDDVGYIRINNFEARTVEDMVKVLAEWRKQPPTSIVLDLRSNPGGLVSAGVGVAAAFLPKESLVVYTQGRTVDSRTDYRADLQEFDDLLEVDPFRNLPSYAKTIPLVVLVDNGSASASEIVAAALQDHQRATIMGERTFGKGSVQTILELQDGSAVKITTARYYSPKGQVIQAHGVIPQVGVYPSNKENKKHLGEADLANHISGSSEPMARHEPEQIIYFQENETFWYGDDKDAQLQSVMGWLRKNQLVALAKDK